METFDCGWLPLDELKPWRRGPRKFYESPALIGCALALSRELYDELRGFDPDMLFWGVEDLDLGLKCWTMGHPILHDPEAVVGHRFRAAFDNYEVPFEHLLVNQLRMARKNFTYSVWCDWVERCRRRHAGRLGEHPEGLWAHAWQLFQQRLASADAERAHVQGRRVRDEFWYAERFGLAWPRIGSQQLSEAVVPLEADGAAASPSPSPSPPPDDVTVSIVMKSPSSKTVSDGTTTSVIVGQKISLWADVVMPAGSVLTKEQWDIPAAKAPGGAQHRAIKDYRQHVLPANDGTPAKTDGTLTRIDPKKDLNGDSVQYYYVGQGTDTVTLTVWVNNKELPPAHATLKAVAPDSWFEGVTTKNKRTGDPPGPVTVALARTTAASCPLARTAKTGLA